LIERVKRMIEKEKNLVDKDRFYWNPATKEKVYSHYVDGSEIKLDAEASKKAGAARIACGARAVRVLEEEPVSRRKPVDKRGGVGKVSEESSGKEKK
jgi:hypothetical protein